ncbi:Probable polygalacturonase [Linum perenne]
MMNEEKQGYGATMMNAMKLSRSSFLLLAAIAAVLCFQVTTRTVYPIWIARTRGSFESDIQPDSGRSCSGFYGKIPARKTVMSIKDFGGIGDGETTNTNVFQDAIRHMEQFGSSGGSQLNVPKGRWLTGSFNLTSNFTLFLEDGAVILGSQAGVRIKTDIGRGGYIANITIRNVVMEGVKIPIKFSRGSNDHPDEGWDRSAVPTVKGIVISNVVSLNAIKAPQLLGIENAPFSGICLKNVTLLGLKKSGSWHCEFLSGFAEDVFPLPCPELQKDVSGCP